MSPRFPVVRFELSNNTGLLKLSKNKSKRIATEDFFIEPKQ